MLFCFYWHTNLYKKLFYRHVYHTDWGSEAAVVRTNLDGSNDKIIVNQLENPNGVHFQGGKGKHTSLSLEDKNNRFEDV